MSEDFVMDFLQSTITGPFSNSVSDNTLQTAWLRRNRDDGILVTRV